MINGRVSPDYFRNILRWHEVVAIERAILAQGIFEGLICGLVLSTVFATVVGLVSKAECSYRLGVRYIGFLLALALACWCVGGLLGMLLASVSPEFYGRTFIGVPDDLGPRICYAWVGGSIWGVQFGGTAALVVVCVLFRAAWRRGMESTPGPVGDIA